MYTYKYRKGGYELERVMRAHELAEENGCDKNTLYMWIKS